MVGDVIGRKVSYLLHLCDQNGDGFVEVEDFEDWVGRMAAIRDWAPGTEEYAGLEALFLDAYKGLHQAYGGADGRMDIRDMTGALVALAMAGGPEFTQWGDGFFRLMDANEDGMVGAEEYRQLMGSVSVDASAADESFVKLDLDGDGQLSRDEFTRLYLEFFQSADMDAPGSWLWGPVR